jgi:hypothetical protein
MHGVLLEMMMMPLQPGSMHACMVCFADCSGGYLSSAAVCSCAHVLALAAHALQMRCRGCMHAITAAFTHQHLGGLCTM